MNKVHLFAGQGYYPESGLGDYQGSYDTFEEADQWIKDDKAAERGSDWYCIIGVTEEGDLEELYSTWVRR